jgi:hemoglobin
MKQHISDVIEAFYAAAREDVLIGYHFLRIENFDEHLPRIKAFWELQLIGETAYEFKAPLDVIKAHIPLRIHTGEVNRWVLLFNKTLKDSQAPLELKEKWEQKVLLFQKIFLSNPLLFPSSSD